jgi:hypothetical protein
VSRDFHLQQGLAKFRTASKHDEVISFTIQIQHLHYSVTMEKIKAALHIHDKTEVPGDGAVGNMQNPSSSDEGPTSEELWGSGNADTKHHHSHKGDTLAAAAGTPKVGFCSPGYP